VPAGAREVAAESGVRHEAQSMPETSPPPPNLPYWARYPSPLAWRLGRELGESSWPVLKLLQGILDRLGEPAVRELVVRVHQIEAEGGMVLEAEQRRRTVGGVFFVLVKAEIGREAWRLEFCPPWWKKRKKAATPVVSEPTVLVIPHDAGSAAAPIGDAPASGETS
jgi:hypothetical protein